MYDWLPYQCSGTQKHVLMDQKRLIVGDPALVKRLYCSLGSSFAGKEDLVTVGYFRILEFWKEFMLLSRKKVNQTEPQGQLVLIPEWIEPCEGGLSGAGTSLAV